MNEPVSLPIFFMIYAKEMNWSVPTFHIELCYWLEQYTPLSLLMLPRRMWEKYHDRDLYCLVYL